MPALCEIGGYILAGMLFLKLSFAESLSGKFSKLWIFAEILLFVLVGAEVNFTVASSDIGKIIGIILFALIFRAAGVTLCLIGSGLNAKERLFCVIAYLPKATVQAAIGAVPLAAGLSCRQTKLTFSRLAILINAPLGGVLTGLFYKKMLNKEKAAEVEA